MRSPFFLVGPTAVGKTDLALEVASRCGAEIISADAFQVYRGLDLLTAKPSPADLRRVRHHLIDICPLSTEYNVARFLEDAQRSLAEIAARGRPALVVGGSGLYVRALTHGLSPLPPAQPALRAELDRWDLDALLVRLRTLDPAAEKMIDTKNRRRLVRAIELCVATGQPLSVSRQLWQAPPPPGAAHGMLLTRDRTELRDRIERRVDGMIPGGVLEEIRSAEAAPLSTTSAKIIGWSEFSGYRRGEIELDACLAAVKTASRRYAKRQLTWFRGKSDFAEVNLSETGDARVVEAVIAQMQAA